MREQTLEILHGYHVPSGGVDGHDLLDLADWLRTVLTPVYRQLEITAVAGNVMKILDTADLEGRPRPASVIFDAVEAYSRYSLSVASGLAPGALTMASVAVGDDPETGALYALLFAQFDEYAWALDEVNFGEYYPYWSDPERPRPLEVSAADWQERAGVWTRVLRGADPKRANGLLKIDIGVPGPDMSLVTEAEAVFSLLPDMEERVEHLTFHQLHGRVFATVEDAEQAAHATSIRVRDLLRPITMEDLTGVAA